MSENINNARSQESMDYQHALEVMYEASESAINYLGQEAVQYAIDVTHLSGVDLLASVVEHAEDLTYRAAVEEPINTVKDAERITSYAAEVSGMGEDLGDEEELDTEVADGAEEYLRKNHVVSAFKLSDQNRDATKYLESKASSEAEVINQKIREQYKGGI